MLREQFSNTMAGTAPNVVSVMFAFTCTGNAKVTLNVAVAGKDVPSAAGTVTCDKTVFQQSVETPKPSPVSFTAKVTGSIDGSFAYAYYPEKTQAP